MMNVYDNDETKHLWQVVLSYRYAPEVNQVVLFVLAPGITSACDIAMKWIELIIFIIIATIIESRIVLRIEPWARSETIIVQAIIRTLGGVAVTLFYAYLFGVPWQ